MFHIYIRRFDVTSNVHKFTRRVSAWSAPRLWKLAPNRPSPVSRLDWLRRRRAGQPPPAPGRKKIRSVSLPGCPLRETEAESQRPRVAPIAAAGGGSGAVARVLEAGNGAGSAGSFPWGKRQREFAGAKQLWTNN